MKGTTFLTTALSGLLLASPVLAQSDLDEIEVEDRSSSPTEIRSTFQRTESFGLGAVLGEPTAISAKFFFARPSAFQLGLGWAIGDRGHFVVLGDYLFHIERLIPAVDFGLFLPYVGLGGRIGIRRGDPDIGLRVPLGFAFFFRGAPLEAFLEVAPGIALFRETEPVIEGGVGLRYYF